MTGAFCSRILFAGTLVAAVALPLTLPGQTPASPQTPAPASKAPGAIYQDALHPLEVVRASTDNWSEPELAALAAACKRHARPATRPSQTTIRAKISTTSRISAPLARTGAQPT